MAETLFRYVIAVASGKGGVGKSTVAVNLAVAMARSGLSVGLLDADIYGPSQHIMLGLPSQDPVVDDQNKLRPVEKFGLKAMSFGFFVKPDDAVVWRGPMISRAFQQMINDVLWGELDFLVVDLPPGTGDIQLTMSQFLNVTGVVIVTTPQIVALADAVKGINMFRKVNIDVIGLIENMSHFECPHCGGKSFIFSEQGGEMMAKKAKTPFLGSLPLEEATRVQSDEGIPIVVAKPQSAQAKRFYEMAGKIVDQAKEIATKKPAARSHPSNAATATGFEV